MTNLYALQEKLSKLEEIRRAYRALPQDDRGITEFLRFAYGNPQARFDHIQRTPRDRTHDERQRYRLAERIHEQAHNIREMPEEAVIKEIHDLRAARKRPVLDAGIYEYTCDEDADFRERKHYTTLIHALQGPVGGRQAFHYFTTYAGGSIFGPEFALSEENERLQGTHRIPVRVYQAKDGAL